MIAVVSGVLLTAEEAEYIVGGFDAFAALLAEQRSVPSSRLAHTIDQLRRTTRKCGAFNVIDSDRTQNATFRGGSRADEADDDNHSCHATVTTAEAASILRVGPSAVRGLAQRDPSKLGSVRIRGRWRHSRECVEHRAVHKGRAVVRYPPVSPPGS